MLSSAPKDFQIAHNIIAIQQQRQRTQQSTIETTKEAKTAEQENEERERAARLKTFRAQLVIFRFLFCFEKFITAR